MKSERSTFIILLVEIVVIGYLHSAKSNQQLPATARQSSIAPQHTSTQIPYQWNNNFTLIRLK
ncbi:hypothetical protein [Paraflavitalea pollutisoli]|uniref:hypothetical protein n=1 Tax=Paraflavitalea pollutisoli TaxID=3034143 RepID=UPI0023EB1028|nr:hypothetical protein [Paraflavitalea sp. H1-2-19X]